VGPCLWATCTDTIRHGGASKVPREIRPKTVFTDFARFHYLLGVGMDCGTQIMQTVLVFCINLPDLSFPTWWGKLRCARHRGEGVRTLTSVPSQGTIQTSPIGVSHRTANYQWYVYRGSKPHVLRHTLIAITHFIRPCRLRLRRNERARMSCEPKCTPMLGTRGCLPAARTIAMLRDSGTGMGLR